MYFETNIPKAPSYLSKEMKDRFNADKAAIEERMEKLEEALKLSCLSGETFSSLISKLWDPNNSSIIDSMPANKLAEVALAMYNGIDAPKRLDWPNAITVFDTAFVKTSEWESMRHIGLGGSDSAVIMEVSPHRTKRSLFYEKRGEVPAIPIKESEAVFARGHFLEDNVVEAFCKSTGAKRIPESRMFASKKNPSSTANIDAIVELKGDIYVFEAKTTVAENFSAWMGGRVPPFYIYQMRQYPAVLDDERIKGTYIGVLFVSDISINDVYAGSSVDADNFVYRFLERDPVTEFNLLEQEAEFFDQLCAGDPPEEYGAKKLETAINYEVGNGPDKSLPCFIFDANDDTGSALAEATRLREKRLQLKKRMEGIEAEEKSLMAEVAKALGESALGFMEYDSDSFIKVSVTQPKETKVNLDALKCYPDVYEACVSVGKRKPQYKAEIVDKNSAAGKKFLKANKIM